MKAQRLSWAGARKVLLLAGVAAVVVGALAISRALANPKKLSTPCSKMQSSVCGTSCADSTPGDHGFCLNTKDGTELPQFATVECCCCTDGYKTRSWAP
jgi:hypothetical protein